tara:strand:- start:20 stop:856 length:837 start_codon:yes stop_codon:yes gene_type:complete
MKQQCTERARTVLDGGMDVYAGSGICLGENNFIAKFYTAAPIGITVEGSNTLTRSLIIFGQGLNKSHPYIGSIVTNIQEDNLKDFSVNIRRMIGYTLSGYFSSLFNITSVGFPDQIHSKLNVSFTNLVNVVALMGGQLKKEQIISGHMADIFSNIYLGWALKYNFNRNNFDEKTLNICLKMLNNETLDSIEKVKNDLPFYLRLLTIGHVNTKKSKVSSKEIEYLSSIIWKNDKIKNYIEEQIVVENNILGKIKECNENYNEELYNDIIQVGENYILEK